jgi:hypothetical protein
LKAKKLKDLGVPKEIVGSASLLVSVAKATGI